MVGAMSDDGWYWCFTHERVEARDERDDPDNALGPYPSPEAATNWRDKVEERAEVWKEADDAWAGEDEDEAGVDAS